MHGAAIFKHRRKRMRNNLNRTVQLIITLTALAVALSVYLIFYTFSYNAILEDIQGRVYNVKKYVESTLTPQVFYDTGDDQFNLEIQETLEGFREIASLKHLYLAKQDESGNISIIMNSMSYEGIEVHEMTEEMLADLKFSIEYKQAIMGRAIYQTAHGSVYTIYWPVLNRNNDVLGAVGMEFNVSSIYASYQRTLVYTVGLSGALIVIFCSVAYISLRKVSVPFYKRLAYTDILTGIQNRMSYEQRLRDCESLLSQGKSITLMMFDVNNLKIVNDTQGHKQGDQLIVNTAKIIKMHLHGLGVLYRIGGDEFAAIIVDRKESEIRNAMNSLRNEERQVLKNLKFSCASGSATFIAGLDSDLQDLVRRADEEMYGEKRRQKERLGGGRRE